MEERLHDPEDSADSFVSDSFLADLPEESLGDCSTSSFYEPADMPDESLNDYLEEFNDMCGGSITCRRMSHTVQRLLQFRIR